MKILHICTSDTGGAGACCLRIHQSLLDAGVESKVVTRNNTKHLEGEYQYGHYNDKIRAAISKMLRKVGLKITLRNIIFELIKKHKTFYSLPVSSIDLTKCEWVEWADIIHLHWVNNYLDYPSFFKKINKPIIWTIHDEGFFYGIAHHHKSILHNNIYEKKYKQIKCDSVKNIKNLSIVFLSEMMFENFGKKTIIEGRKKLVINNSVNTNIFQPKGRMAMRRKYGIDSESIIFLFLSMNITDKNKGLDVLSEALYELDINAKILAVGSNPLQKKWSNVISFGIVRNQETLCELISSANYMAMPSFQEAFPLSPMEAMACGIPVVAFPVSGTSELIRDYNGVVCDNFTKESLKAGILSLMKQSYDPGKIRQDMLDRFSPEATAQKYITLYESISY